LGDPVEEEAVTVRTEADVMAVGEIELDRTGARDAEGVEKDEVSAPRELTVPPGLARDLATTRAPEEVETPGELEPAATGIEAAGRVPQDSFSDGRLQTGDLRSLVADRAGRRGVGVRLAVRTHVLALDDVLVAVERDHLAQPVLGKPMVGCDWLIEEALRDRC
jgi:hypothetical protein